jgi:hypothetical protein
MRHRKFFLGLCNVGWLLPALPGAECVRSTLHPPIHVSVCRVLSRRVLPCSLPKRVRSSLGLRGPPRRGQYHPSLMGLWAAVRRDLTQSSGMGASSRLRRLEHVTSTRLSTPDIYRRETLANPDVYIPSIHFTFSSDTAINATSIAKTRMPTRTQRTESVSRHQWMEGFSKCGNKLPHEDACTDGDAARTQHFHHASIQCASPGTIAPEV